jgi:hypothetical protein
MAQTELQRIGDLRRPQLDAIGLYRTTRSLPYNRNHPYVFSEGIGGNNWGKDPQTPPTSDAESYKTVGSKDDIIARIGQNSPGTLAQNDYYVGGNVYDYGDVEVYIAP